MVAAVLDNAGLYRFIRGNLVGAATENPDLWDFCGTQSCRNLRFWEPRSSPSSRLASVIGAFSGGGLVPQASSPDSEAAWVAPYRPAPLS